MRAFHYSYACFFSAFIAWFAVAPLLPTIKATLGMTKDQVWVSNICSVLATVFMRFIVGPLCDIYGPRVTMSAILILGSIPVFLLGAVTTFEGLCITRAFIGIIGAAFVMCQYWTSSMFSREIVGTANAIVGGWGNLGGGVTQLFMGSALFPLFLLFTQGDEELAWRTVFVIPAFLTALMGVLCYFYSDDTPKGNLSEVKAKDDMVSQLIGQEGTAIAFTTLIGRAFVSFFEAMSNPNTLILMFQYGACFGVELTMNNAAASYFFSEFGQSQAKAAAIASSFGFMNIVARGLGGWLSDYLNTFMGMRGRLVAQVGCLMGEGAMIFIFAEQKTLGTAIVSLIFFSIFVQAAEGSSYGIVPFIDPMNTGAVSGAVGAGGNMGAVLWGLIFLYGNDYTVSFQTLGSIVFASSVVTFFIRIPGFAMLICGEDRPEEQAKGKATGLGMRGMSFDELVNSAHGDKGHDMVEIKGGKITKKFSSNDNLEQAGTIAAAEEEAAAKNLI
jgi:NNP family nitrate/nitrite transporter-like MFS transporter